MQRTLFRALSAFAIAAVLSTGIWNSSSASADTSREWQFDGSSEFAVEVFPHDTAAIRFSDSWGNRRPGGRRHSGTDIISPRGTEVLAVADGIVTEMGASHMSGYFIRVEHADEWVTSYLHLNNDTNGTDDGAGGTWTAFHPTLQEGDEVVAGQVIGYVGDSGNAEGTIPHTHFEIKHDGEKRNPYPFLRSALEREMQDRYGLHF